MKYKNDFVTNSSSTSFFFIYKRGIDGLFQALANHANEFDLTHEEWDNSITSMNVGHVVQELEPLIDSGDVRSFSLNELMKEFEEDIVRYDKWIKEDKNRGAFSFDLYYDLKKEATEKLETIKDAKKRGFTHCLRVGFGDNDGHVSGTGIGSTMDYEGRHINIDDHDLIVFTEQNR